MIVEFHSYQDIIYGHNPPCLTSKVFSIYLSNSSHPVSYFEFPFHKQVRRG